ncbi:hypothetical protein [Roseateles puraquae]|uniref:Response regulatory domain-containing protein n=1 Tax=Roseateles puraquae TaxID=431059 RepID=A0A254N9U7_9BURK|nr:hypothetical protein [Roseateles puraquae]MDG0855730.1 hypothetical protein [Roseateles puraquae]MDG0855793.1 hypothetical protein [Roseateles puraquae]OWR03137.1 hypothetical protein CDO81_16360 [Roseateles puraquae]
MPQDTPYDLPRVLVVCNTTALRRELADLLYEMWVEPHWHLQLGGLAEYAAWCRPQVIVLAMRSPQENLAAYTALEAAYGDSPAVVIGMLGVPMDGLAFPARSRLQLDSYLTPPPSLHELAWLIGRATEGKRPRSIRDLPAEVPTVTQGKPDAT